MNSVELEGTLSGIGGNFDADGWLFAWGWISVPHAVRKGATTKVPWRGSFERADILEMEGERVRMLGALEWRRREDQFELVVRVLSIDAEADEAPAKAAARPAPAKAARPVQAAKARPAKAAAAARKGGGR